MGNLFRKLKSAKGAVTIEATISLTSFLFLFMMLYSIITICRTQAIIQVAINSTAKELSQYSYLYSISGLHGAMQQVAGGAAGTKQDINSVVNNVSDVMNGIQKIAGTNEDGTDKNKEEDGTDKTSLKNMMDKWDGLMTDLDETGAAATAAMQTIQDMAKDPKELAFGMAKLIVSEGSEVAKSLLAEALSRAMVQKHLERGGGVSAEDFCRSVGIIPGSYINQESYFNGIDFAHSTILPYQSSEITIVANYKMRLLPLLPVDISFHFTQTAVTLAWLQGDVELPNTPEEVVLQRGENAIWNSPDGGERERLIRNQALTELKKSGYYGVSGNSYVHAYKPGDPQTLVAVRSFNPLVGYNSVGAVNPKEIQARLEKISSQLTSSTDNIQTIKVKKTENGQTKTESMDCTKTAIKLKVILVIPEDEGLKEEFEKALKSVDTEVEFEFLQSYGTVFGDKTTDDELGGT